VGRSIAQQPKMEIQTKKGPNNIVPNKSDEKHITPYSNLIVLSGFDPVLESGSIGSFLSDYPYISQQIYHQGCIGRILYQIGT